MLRRTSRRDPGGDDFTLISGIEPGISRQLHGAGVTTYAQLAALRVSDIVALLSDIPVERISEEDWSGQAAKLAATAAAKDEPTGEAPAEGERAEEAPAEGTTVPAGRPVLDETERERPEPVAPATAAESPSSVAGSLVTVAPDRRVVHTGEPFTVYLTLNLTQGELPPDVRHTAVVFARPLGGGLPRTVSESTGLLAPKAPKIGLDNAGLPAGTYRLEAVVELLESGSARPRDLLGGKEDGVLTVIDR